MNELGAVAQLGEHLLCKQGVIGSIPFSSTKFKLLCAVRRETQHLERDAAAVEGELGKGSALMAGRSGKSQGLGL